MGRRKPPDRDHNHAAPGQRTRNHQTTPYTYDTIGRRVGKHDRFGSTVFIWEGMRLIEERRGSSVISYVYEPGSYVPLARLDATGDKTEQGGLGTQDDPVLPPLPLGEGGGEGHPRQQEAPESIAPSRFLTPTNGPNHSKPAANDAESLYWASLNQQAEQKAQALNIEGWGTGTDGPARQTAQAKIAEVYYFHTDQVGLPEELSNSQGQLVWQATYKTWGNTQAEEWKRVDLDGGRIHQLDEGDIPEQEAKQQNLRFQGQYLDRDTGLHYNTFRFYDPDIGRFISPDPIGLEGGLNLGIYSPNPISWIDPWGWDEVYALIADKPGWYDVYEWGKKKPVGQVWLDKGDLWKIGTTKNPNTRYSGKWLASMNLGKVTLFEGISRATTRFIERQRLKGHMAAKGGRLPPGNKCAH